MKTYDPNISVRVIKATPRHKFSELDITYWLGENSVIETTKSVHQPAGTFTFTLPDKPYKGLSLNALLEPMDFVEIRMTHGGATGSELPLIMRGFISDISKSETISGGKPQRWLRITGHDMGKILQLIQVVYLPSSITAKYYIAAFRWNDVFAEGSQVKSKSASDFINEAVNIVVNPFIAKFTALSAPSKQSRVVNRLSVDVNVEGMVSAYTPNMFENVSLHQMLTTIVDVPTFNELYTEDTEQGTTLVVKPSPMKDLYTGKFIQGHADSITIPEVDIISQQTSRSDSGVANYFWVLPNNYGMETNQLMKQIAAADSLDTYATFEYKNSKMDTYGFRKMEVESVLMPPEYRHSDSPDEDKVSMDRSNDENWIAERRTLLRDMNRDNVLLESGRLSLRGNEAIKAGQYLNVERSGVVIGEVYAHSVTHTFRPMQSYFTNVAFDRGTLFANANNLI